MLFDRPAFRSLRHNPGFFITSVLTIALGVGGTTAVFSAVDAVMLKPLPYRAPGQLVRIYSSSSRNPDGRGVVTPVHYVTYRREAGTLQSVAAINLYDRSGADIGTGNDVRRIRTLSVSADYFDVLKTLPALGRPFTRGEENGPKFDGSVAAPVVILSHSLWRDRFHSDPNIVGTSLTMSGVPYTVLGVMPVDFADPVAGSDVDAWVPLNLTPGTDPQNITDHYLSLIGRAQPGLTDQQVTAELDGITERLTAPYPRLHDDRVAVVPLKEDVVGSAGRALGLMLGAVGLVLLLVCVNVANLQLVRGSERARELAVRSALGAGPSRLVRQLFTESAIIAAAGAILGLVCGRLGMSALRALGASSIPRLAGMRLDFSVLAFAIAVGGAAALLFGVAPAWHASRVDPADALRGSGRSTTGDRAQGRLRAGLVVCQVALAFVLLSSAGVLLASLRNVANTPLGVAPDSVMTFRVYLPDARYDSTARAIFYETLNARIEALPGVRSAAGVSWLPATTGYHNWGVNAVTGPLAGSQQGNAGADNRVITSDYFRTVGIPLLAGRAFDAGDRMGSPDRVIISKALADRLFPGVDPLGQELQAAGRTNTVIGVVPDVAVDVQGRRLPYVYHAHSQFAGNRNWPLFEVVATRGGAPDGLVADLRTTLQGLDPLLVLDHPAPLVDVIGRGTAQRKFTLVTLLAFAGTALALAGLGVFGVLSYAVRLRSTEFGIRLALGATPWSIVTGVLRQGGVVIAMGLGLGLGGAVLGSQVLASMVFHVSPLDPRVLMAAAVTLAVLGTGAAWIPARRAAAADPRTVLSGD